ncbi:hypothetical protein D7D52_37190 [Nocardia yunnanensis]|uniref:SRPBCC family protein n=1 Tax=Nocardia yunnanensis TaxID=2382165 RepID=A0A386ZMV2_9NOCA|nr:SRPBCC family protein [Nocardia yunnanensis]AYF78530.1 hypothetical protein D7D52_37190 [Nocardia yunnanensis]
MQIVDKALEEVTGLVGKVVGKAPISDNGQTLTVAAPPDRVAEFWRDPHNLSRVLGDFGAVSVTGPDRYRWTLNAPGGQTLTWESTLEDTAHGLRFRGVPQGDGAAGASWIRVDFGTAPQQLGTEVRLHARLPLPGLLTGAAAFTVLYRARALLQTGELPTLHHNPSARTGDR